MTEPIVFNEAIDIAATSRMQGGWQPQLAMITPPTQEALEYAKLFRGRFCLAFAARKYKVYRDFYTAGAPTNPHSNVMLDHGIYEGVALSDEDYLEVVQQIKPAVVICPDRFGEPLHESAKRALDFIEKAHNQLTLAEQPQYLWVPHEVPACKGPTWWRYINNYLSTVLDYCTLRSWQWLGISYRQIMSLYGHDWLHARNVNRAALRMVFFDLLQSTGFLTECLQRGIKLHFLGCSPGEYGFIGKYTPYVTSMDTASLYWHVVCGFAAEEGRPEYYFKPECLSQPILPPNKTEALQRVTRLLMELQPHLECRQTTEAELYGDK